MTKFNLHIPREVGVKTYRIKIWNLESIGRVVLTADVDRYGLIDILKYMFVHSDEKIEELMEQLEREGGMQTKLSSVGTLSMVAVEIK